MAEPWEWTEQDLQDLITNQVEENLNLDYKRHNSLETSDNRKNEVSRDVSAFANSDGGVLVYGMEETGHLPTRLDGVTASAITREWVEQVINSRIRPRISGIQINPVRLTLGTGTVFIVSIPKSPDAPHMAWDHKYYKRYNFEALPMEHYEVEDVRSRHNGPLLSLALTQLMSAGNNRVRITFHITNTSPVMALYSLLLLKVEGANLTSASQGWSSERPYLRGTLLQKNIAIPERLPIWKGVPLSLGASVSLECPELSEFCLEWTLLSPEMLAQSGVFWFRTINGAISEIEDAATIETLNASRAVRDQGIDTGLFNAS